MATLEIRKETDKVWKHIPSNEPAYIVSKLYIKSDGDNIRVVELGGSQRGIYNVNNISLFDIGGTAETFTTASDLMQRLEALGYIGFFYEGEVSPSILISSDLYNAITLGSDGKLYVDLSGVGSVDSVNGQTGIVVLNADDISDAITTNKFVTSAEKTTWNNKQDILTEDNFGEFVASLEGKDALSDDDKFNITDVDDSDKQKKFTFLKLKTQLKTYFDTIYTTSSAVASQISTALVGYATQSWVTSQGYITNVISALGFTPENVANKSTSTTLGTSDTLYPTQNAVKTYADTKVDKVTTTGVERVYTINPNGSQSTKNLDLKIVDNVRVSTTNASQTLVKRYTIGKIQDFKKIKFNICTNRTGAVNVSIKIQLTPTVSGTAIELLSISYNSLSGNFNRLFTTINSSANVIYQPQTSLTNDLGSNAAFNTSSFDSLQDYYLDIYLSTPAGGEVFVNSFEAEFLR